MGVRYDDERRRYAVSLEKGAAHVKDDVFLPEWRLYRPVAMSSSDVKGKPRYNLHLVLRRNSVSSRASDPATFLLADIFLRV